MSSKGQDRLQKRLYSVDEAAVFLGRTPGAVRELIFKGKLPKVAIDRRVQLDRHDLDRLIDTHKVTEDAF